MQKFPVFHHVGVDWLLLRLAAVLYCYIILEKQQKRSSWNNYWQKRQEFKFWYCSSSMHWSFRGKGLCGEYLQDGLIINRNISLHKTFFFNERLKVFPHNKIFGKNRVSVQFSFNSSPRHEQRGFKGEKNLQNIVLNLGEEIRQITLARIFAGKKKV